jgi:hypothetical protein
VILPRPTCRLEVAVDQCDGAVQRVLADIGHDDVIARQGTDMRDAVAHLACTDNADRLDLHDRPFASVRVRTIGPLRKDAQALPPRQSGALRKPSNASSFGKSEA